MKITVLGCGSSGGVPLIGNNWGDCDPKDPRNRRRRVSVLVEQGADAVLVDASPDLREQLLDARVDKLTGVVFTHAHADHAHGIDDLRSLSWLMKKPADIYADAATLADLQTRFDYIFQGRAGTSYAPICAAHTIDGAFKVGGIAVTPFVQDHGYGTSLGLRFGDFAYSTDVKNLDEVAFAALKDVKVWIVDCVREEPHPTHAHLALALEWIARVKPGRAYLTHMSQRLDYAALAAKLPAGVAPAHDGLVIEC